jgi:hypothetical protein
VGPGPICVDKDVVRISGNGHWNLLGSSAIALGAWWRKDRWSSRAAISRIEPALDTTTSASTLPCWPIQSAECSQARAACGGFALSLADDPRIDPAAVLYLDRWAVRPLLDDDPGAVAVVRHPVRLQCDRHIGDHGRRKDPVEMGRVQPIGKVGDPDRPSTLDPGQEMDHPESRERVARLGDHRGCDVRIRQPGRRGPERPETGRRIGNRRVGRHRRCGSPSNPVGIAKPTPSRSGTTSAAGRVAGAGGFAASA